ncbi:hypothetical protein TIFTF001_026708 [Ficus carica]|uniref:Uncharacterized protein n=1 Tax=Ficus carica TaxID=3494 RepID=A0AA88IYI2_FICCA|nr:hypothetical protein TIFTF001_026708 [Ficus carica]
MHKSVSDTNEQAEKQSFSKKNNSYLNEPPLDECNVPFQSDDGGHKYRLVLVWVASTMLVWLGGEDWRQGRSKDKYSNRLWMLGVRWCRVVGVAYCAIVLLSAGTGRRDRNSMGSVT